MRAWGIFFVALLVSPHGVALVSGLELEQRPRTVYTAQSLFSVKEIVDVNKMWLEARPLWIEKPSGKGVTIAVIDTGANLQHPDLQGKLACPYCWRDFVGDRSTGLPQGSPYDDHGHGTHIAGIVSAHGHLQVNPLNYYWLTGARGIAPDAKLIVAKAMNYKGEGDDPVVAQAVAWAADPDGDGDPEDGADIINLSIGIEEPQEGPAGSVPTIRVGSETKSAILSAIRMGVVVVVSSGNDGQPRVSEPGDIPDVITVAATDKDGRLTDFSNYGEGLDLVAPGVIVSTFPVALDTVDFAQDGYVGMAGTSMAAPVVTGIAALMMEADPALARKSAAEDLTEKVRQIQALLRSHAVPASGADAVRTGAGVVNAHNVVVSVDKGSGALLWWVVFLIAAAVLIVAGGVFLVWRRRMRDAQEREEFARAVAAQEPPGEAVFVRVTRMPGAPSEAGAERPEDER